MLLQAFNYSKRFFIKRILKYRVQVHRVGSIVGVLECEISARRHWIYHSAAGLLVQTWQVDPALLFTWRQRRSGKLACHQRRTRAFSSAACPSLHSCASITHSKPSTRLSKRAPKNKKPLTKLETLESAAQLSSFPLIFAQYSGRIPADLRKRLSPQYKTQVEFL
jgi:hypothetical protein